MSGENRAASGGRLSEGCRPPASDIRPSPYTVSLELPMPDMSSEIVIRPLSRVALPTGTVRAFPRAAPPNGPGRDRPGPRPRRGPGLRGLPAPLLYLLRLRFAELRVGDGAAVATGSRAGFGLPR